MITTAFVAIAFVTLAAALGAALLPRLIHAALSLVVAFAGAAAFYFLLGAEFVGLAQVLVYVGAVAVLIVFTILLTQPNDEKREPIRWDGIAVSAAVFAGLIWAICGSPTVALAAPAAPPLTVEMIGESLMNGYVWPLECTGLLLTAALIGALVLAMEEKR